MRLLFSGSPAYGHILPMLPLLRAASREGHGVAVLTSSDLAEIINPIPILDAGPTFEELLAENVRRNPTGMGAGTGARVGPAEAAEFFAATRVDSTLPAALTASTAFAPDLIVCETADYVGPLVADLHGVPWVTHGFGVELPGAFVNQMDEVAASTFERNGAQVTERRAYLDPCADFLQHDGWQPPADRITVRPEPFAVVGSTWKPPHFEGAAAQGVVLVTFGTVVQDVALVAGVMESLEEANVHALVTSGPGSTNALADSTRSWAVDVGFVPLADLLDVVDAVVTVGGAGTVLSSLTAAKPMIVLPILPDHHWNGERAASTGSAIVIESSEDVGAAVGEILTQPSYREAAIRTAARIAEMNSPETALALLIGRIAA